MPGSKPSHPAPSHSPDRDTALALYRRRAATYDFELALFEPIRRLAIEQLALRPGDVVLDVGCGTGLSFQLLHAGVGRTGRVVGIEQSPPMIEHARERVRRAHWHNVSLVCAPAETAELPMHANAADAALLHFTHDILRSPAALANVVRHLRPGARVVAAGLKWAPAWAAMANLFVLPAALYSVTSLEGLHEPWSTLASFTTAPDVQTLLWGSVFVARATVTRRAG